MATLPKYCHICNKGPFGGPVPAQQHFQSDHHKSKEIAMIEYGTRQMSNPYYCHDCNISANSQQTLAEHLSSPRHRAAVERAGERNREGFRSDTAKQSQQLRSDSTTGSDNKNFDPVELEFNGQYGCGICNVLYTSQSSAIQHLKGEKHRKAKSNTQQKNSENLLNCNACGKVFMNAFSAEQHFSSEKHKKIVQQNQNGQFTTGNSVSSTIYSRASSETNTTNALEDSFYPQENLVSLQPNIASPITVTVASGHRQLNIESQLQALDLEIEEEVPHLPGNKNSNHAPEIFPANCSAQNLNSNHSQEVYTFDGTRGHCYACKIEFTSHAHANQHLQGQKHKKNCERFAGRSEPTKNLHVGRQQSVVKDNADATSKQKSEPKEYEWNGSRGWCNICNFELESEQHAKQHLTGKNHQKKKKFQCDTDNPEDSSLYCSVVKDNADVALKQNSDPKEYEWYGARGWCNICNFELESEQHAKQHLMGKNHQKKKKFQFDTDKPEDSSLYCAVCDKHFSGPECANQHYASAKHIQRAGLAGMQHQQQSPLLPQGAGVGHDKTNWYECEICCCKLNSREQLEIHKSSPRHKAEEAKRLQRQNSSPHENRQYIPGNVGISNMRISFTPHQNSNPRNVELGEPVKSPEHLPDVVQFGQQQPSSRFSNAALDQISMNLSQGFLFNKISFGELCPEESVREEHSDASNLSSATRIFASTSETDLKSITREHQSLLQDKLTHYISSALNTQIEEKAMPEKEPIGHKSSASDASTNRGDSWEFTTATSGEVYHNVLDPKSEKEEIDGESSTHENSAQNFSQKSQKSKGSDQARALRNRPKRSNSRNVGSASETPCDDYSDDASYRCTDELSRKYQEEAAALVMSNLEHMAKTGAIGQGHIAAPSPTPTGFNTVSSPSRSNEPVKTPSPNKQHISGNASPDMAQSPFPHHKYYCRTCKSPMNSEKAYRDHMTGRRHMQKVAEEPALQRQHHPLAKTFYYYHRLEFDLTKTKPRQYQRELLSEAMKGDTVIFLPTGTGKTLIASMAVSAMLEQNPTRQVVFLVDRVLLVIQQSQYLINEIGDRVYHRFNPDDLDKEQPQTTLVERKLNIAALCGGQQSTGGVPLWKHDLIIVTAAFYENLLSRGILRWSDLSLVVFDEAHHCVKNHPFNKLLQTYHVGTGMSERPKLLGLTASPAGKDTVEATLFMLLQFMANMGDTKMSIVQRNKPELMMYQSNAEIKVMVAQTSRKETSFQKQLQLYLLQCYMRFCGETDMLEQCNLGLNATMKKNLTADDRAQCAGELFGDMLNSLEVTLDKAHPRNNDAASRLRVANLSRHISYLCYALNSLYEAGLQTALEEIQELMASSESCNFEFARGIGLQSDKLLGELQTCLAMEAPARAISPNEGSVSSKLDCLVACLLDRDNINWAQREAFPMALVLVKQRSTARLVCSLLEVEDTIKSHGLSVVYVVGHGAGRTDGGMRVNQQRRVLEEIREHRHHIIVATSVAEEGVDIPECQLVISMNPPTSVTAMVQMRGRARKARSKFVIVCTDMEEKRKLEELQKKEENMVKATAIIVQQQQQGR